MALLRHMARGGPGSRLAELFGMCGFAFLQPLLSVLGQAPDFFIFRRASAAEIVAFAVVVAVVPPVLLWAVERMVAAARPAVAGRVHGAVLVSLGILVVFNLLRSMTSLHNAAFLLVVAVVVSLFAPVIVRRAAAVRLWVRYAAAAPIAFVVLFLVASPVRHLLQTADAAEVVAPGPGGSPLVMIILDELPLMSLLDDAGQVDGRLFPNFAALARQSTFFRNTTTVASRTPFAVPALLTGRMPVRRAAPSASAYPDNLFTLLAGSHDLRVFEALTALCPARVCERLRGAATADVGVRALLRDSTRVWFRTVSFKRYDEDPAGLWLQEELAMDRVRRRGAGATDARDPWFLMDHAAENQPARFREFLASIDGQGTPLHFLHLVLPHSPWEYLPDGRRYNDVRLGYDQPEERNAQTWPAVLDEQRHLLQVAYVDGVLGEVFGRLRDVGLYDRSAVVVVADHGISFVTGPGHSERDFSDITAPGVAWVPFLLKLPGQQEGQVRDDNVMTVDVLPTVAEAVGARLTWRTDGVSVLEPRRGDDRKSIFNEPGNEVRFDGSRWLGLVRGGVTDRLLRPGEGVEGMFRVGPFRDLVGTPVRDHVILPPDGSRVTIDRLADYRRPDREAATLPALISGDVESAGRSDILGVAIALDGNIAGASPTFREGDVSRKFASMLLPELFGPGQGIPEVYLLVGDAGRPELVPAAVTR
ncbi:MAG: sulfatase-like hydrolase/transferase [Actinomycetota bacterium]